MRPGHTTEIVSAATPTFQRRTSLSIPPADPRDSVDPVPTPATSMPPLLAVARPAESQAASCPADPPATRARPMPTAGTAVPRAGSTGRSTTSPASCRRRRSSRPRRPSTPSRRGPAPRSSSTRSCVDYGVTTEETERPARRSSTSGASAARASTTGWPSSSTSTRRASTARSSCTRRPASRRRTCPTASGRGSSTTTCCRTCARPISTAHLAAMDRVARPPPPENARGWSRPPGQRGRRAGRRADRVLGAGRLGVLHWRRFGKDPVYLDDPSILMPAPPPDLTAASGAFVMDGGTSRRALTTAMLDLASRGQIAFREEKGMLGLANKVGIDIDPPAATRRRGAARAQRRRPIGRPERSRCAAAPLGRPSNYIEPDDCPKFGAAVAGFDAALETHVVAGGWMAEEPSKVVGRWGLRGALAIGVGVGRPDRRVQRPDVRARAPGRGGHRRRDRDRCSWPAHAVRHDARRDGPGDARRLPADAPEDDGAGALDAAGRRRGRPRLARDARPGGRVGHGARPAGRDRGRPRRDSRTSRRARSRRRPTSRSGTRLGRPSFASAARRQRRRSSRARPSRTSAG